MHPSSSPSLTSTGSNLSVDLLLKPTVTHSFTVDAGTLIQNAYSVTELEALPYIVKRDCFSFKGNMVTSSGQYNNP